MRATRRHFSLLLRAMLLLLLKVGKKNEVLFFFSPPPSFSPLFFWVWFGGVLDMNDYKKGKKEIKEETNSLARAFARTVLRERETFFFG